MTTLFAIAFLLDAYASRLFIFRFLRVERRKTP